MVQRGAELSQLQRPSSTALYASGEGRGVIQEQDLGDGYWTDEQVEEEALIEGHLEYEQGRIRDACSTIVVIVQVRLKGSDYGSTRTCAVKFESIIVQCRPGLQCYINSKVSIMWALLKHRYYSTIKTETGTRSLECVTSL